MNSSLEWIMLIFFSFLPPLIYTVWIRNTEKCNREKWVTIFICFIWGASLAVIAAIIIEILLQMELYVSITDAATVNFLTVVVVAPVAEEFTKPLVLGLKTVRKELDELEDGLIYGAVAGLGFSATENLFYGNRFLAEGIFVFLVLIAVRSFSSCLLHASATALTGYGYGKAVMKHSSIIRVIPYFILAILVHGFYNFTLTFEMPGLLTGVVFAFLFVAFAISYVRGKIKKLDAQTC